MLFSMWMLSYDDSLAERLRWEHPDDEAITVHSLSNPKKGLMRELVRLLRSSERTRVVRVVLLCLRNLLGHGLNQQMVDVGSLPAIRALLERVWPDVDIHADAAHVLKSLEADQIALSSWALFRQDVLSRNLSWSNPCHKDDAFWRNNARHFEANSCSTLHSLLGLLEEQLEGPASIGDLYSPVMLAVACRDVGQIVVAHPRGHAMLGTERAKRLCLQAATLHADEDVRREALLATQRLMVATLGSAS